ncbi:MULTISPECIES: TetR family transcriptional regulator [unclassified Pseudomonas]|uniref:TetR/AcrR family transcriptional regulator n=1 Tax=unclassified Pseudomonas TaxID=196821 RepID=UPI002B22BFBB|nr:MULTISPECIES: TetR family transcriptional regulator [unclassified Pseudomonas]MEA9977866.1 TetR family transcriptional regulator [Pseudomonas sp. RTS4]MEB0196051.1 TetR family transcriptional regulator [Pseudomonas sp. 5S4]MEB0245545.1 TetR family transcriptional regulator [Pseudomonas sp. 10S5]
MTRGIAQEGAAGIATAVALSVQYQGRKASQRGSEQRRQDILDAAMRIVVRDGVRSVRHRAVATEARVPLSATTYYFKDMDDLITDAFSQYVERSAAYMAKLWGNTEVVLRGMLALSDGSAQSRAQLADDIALMALEYLRHQLTTRREHLIAEHAFHHEALINPRLVQLVSAHQQILLQGTFQFLQVMGSTQPQQDAQVLTGIICRMEYQGLLDGPQPDGDETMLGILTRYMHLVLGAPTLTSE